MVVPAPPVTQTAAEDRQKSQMQDKNKTAESPLPATVLLPASASNTRTEQTSEERSTDRPPKHDTSEKSAGRRTGWTPSRAQYLNMNHSPVTQDMKPELASGNEPTNTQGKPMVFVPPRECPLPKQATIPYFERQPDKGFPYQLNKSRLPPEVTAFIEAYDCAHAVSTGGMTYVTLMNGVCCNFGDTVTSQSKFYHYMHFLTVTLIIHKDQFI